MAILKKVISILSNAGVIMLIIYALVLVPQIKGYHPVVVLSGSMEPKYKVGTVIYYCDISINELKEGDVITFQYDSDDVIAHRINSIVDGVIQTKGDANAKPDMNELTYQNILGKVTSISIPLLGYLICFLNNYRFILIVILFLIVLDIVLDKIIEENKVKLV